jgi:phosphatidylserine/phosphatidylglycerophosphate/cardiolipin synthase-like enzyme
MAIRARRLVALVVAVLVVLGTGVAWVVQARYADRPSAQTYRAPRGVLVAVPADEPEQNAIYRVLMDNIRHTPSGARIRITAHSITLVPTARALIAAARRGVGVQIVADRAITQRYRATRALVSALGEDRSADSYIHLTSGAGRAAEGHQHQKTWMFSRTGSSRRVVMVGSMNLTYYSTREYNDMVAFVGRRRPWRAFDRVFREISAEKPLATPQRTVPMGPDTAFFFPGFSLTDDPVQRALADIPAGPTTRIRVVQQGWLDTRGRAIAERLAQLARSGADVQVVHGRFFGERVERLLRAADVPVYDGVFGTGGDDVHSKLMFAQYRDADGRRRRIATTGSDNWSDRSFRNGEVLVRLDLTRGPGFARYDRFFEGLKERARSRS